MTPERAADLLANESPDPQPGRCSRCYTVSSAGLYREPEHLFDNEPAEAVCPPCVRRIAGKSRDRDRVSLSMNL